MVGAAPQGTGRSQGRVMMEVARPGRGGFWMGVGVGAGSGVVLAALACVALTLFSASRASAPGGEDVTASNGTTYQWELVPEMAVRLAPVYEPGYLPPGVGYPTIRVTTSGESETMTATHAGGLVLRQTNSELRKIVGGARLEPTRVRASEEAGFARWRGVRALLVRKGDSWLILSGQPDAELVRVAESLRPLPETGGAP